MTKIINRFCGVYLVGVALVIFAQFLLEFTYELESVMRVWFILDWFSLAGFGMCVLANGCYMRAHLDETSVTWKKLSSTVLFYISAGTTIAFLHNFAADLFGNNDDLLFWKFINVVQIPLFAVTGCRLFRVS
ncbi:MAG: hypothetical protein OXH84_07485 [Gammaproteobacteria bacterium]|nr:hypothetical protein [Gammaproteobacteria bacterium]